MKNQTLEIVKDGATVTIRNGISTLLIDGTDFASDREWRSAIAEEVRQMISRWTIEEES